MILIFVGFLQDELFNVISVELHLDYAEILLATADQIQKHSKFIAIVHVSFDILPGVKFLGL